MNGNLEMLSLWSNSIDYISFVVVNPMAKVMAMNEINLIIIYKFVM